jgi:hypothetical protein
MDKKIINDDGLNLYDYIFVLLALYMQHNSGENY